MDLVAVTNWTSYVIQTGGNIAVEEAPGVSYNQKNTLFATLPYRDRSIFQSVCQQPTAVWVANDDSQGAVNTLYVIC